MKQKLALCFGDNYPGTDFGLDNCVHDAMDFANAVTKLGFIPEVLLDKKVTRKALLESLERKILHEGKSGDTVLIFYSGHGSYEPEEHPNPDEPDGVDECWCPYDCEMQGNVLDDTVYKLCKERPRNMKLIIFSDSCFSGTVARLGLLGINMPKRIKSRFLPPEHFLSMEKLKHLGERRENFKSGFGKKLKIKTSQEYSNEANVIIDPNRDETNNERIINPTLLMSACNEHETASDAPFWGAHNGAFTYYLLKELEELQKIGMPFTYRTWHAAVRKHLPSSSAQQSPQLHGVNRDWVALA